MTCVIDASVAAKWVVPEPDSALAEALLDEVLIVPDLIFAEVGNILRKKQTRGELSAEAAQLGVRWLLQVPVQVHDSASLLVDGLALATRLGHPTYDCLYLALARRTGAVLVTADRRLHARCHAADAVELAPLVRLLDAR